MSALNSLLPVLQCPLYKEEKFNFDLNLKALVCGGCAAEYPVVHGIPVLLQADNGVLCRRLSTCRHYVIRSIY
jgi:uncharacterized protein YbaR (Trm112 family)